MLFKNESIKYFTAANVQSCVNSQTPLSSSTPPSFSPSKGRFFCHLGHVYHKWVLFHVMCYAVMWNRIIV